MKKKDQICVTVDPSILAKVREIAKRDDRSISYTMNLLLKAGLGEPKRMRKLIKRNPGRNFQAPDIQEAV